MNESKWFENNRVLGKNTKNTVNLGLSGNTWLVQAKTISFLGWIFISIASAVSTEIANNLLTTSVNERPPIKYLPSSSIKLLLSDMLIILLFPYHAWKT